jgi:peroxiredoxin
MAKLSDFVAGVKFPDLALPDHTGTVVKISDFTNNGRDPVAVIFYRGWY